jgi:hypothetical protein
MMVAHWRTELVRFIVSHVARKGRGEQMKLWSYLLPLQYQENGALVGWSAINPSQMVFSNLPPAIVESKTIGFH